MLSGRTAYVTGATGFLGTSLVKRLASEGVKVRALAHRANRDRFIRDLPNVEVVQGDITDTGLMNSLIQGSDYVFHAAAALSGDLETQRQVNRYGTRSVLQAAANSGVQRFVHVSTISVYGYRNQSDVTETTPMDPGADAYAVTKAEAELTIRELSGKLNIAYSIVRPGMIYGPRSSMWTRTMFTIARRNPTIWIGDGSGSAYPIYIDDVVDLCVAVASHPSAVDEVFNCTPDPSPTWREFLGAYSSLVGHRRWLGIPPWVLRPVGAVAGKVARRHSTLKDLPDLLPFSQRYITYKMDKARDLLGWQPKVSLKEGIHLCKPYLREKGLL